MGGHSVTVPPGDRGTSSRSGGDCAWGWGGVQGYETHAAPVSALRFVSIAMVLRLSGDELQCISDFAQSSALSRVCGWTWTLLRRRHVSCRVDAHNISQIMARLKDDADIHTATLRCDGVDDDGAQKLAELKDAVSVRSLTLRLPYSKLGDRSARALSSLKVCDRAPQPPQARLSVTPPTMSGLGRVCRGTCGGWDACRRRAVGARASQPSVTEER